MNVPRMVAVAAIPVLAGLGSFYGTQSPSARQDAPAKQESAATVGVPATQLGLAIHDPCIISDHGVYHVYATGPFIPECVSRDLVHWTPAGSVWEGGGPAWIRTELPDSRGFWAPDICFYGGRYHLTYAVSRFGSNRSIIGMASNKTLDRTNRDYRWTDDGKVTELRREDNFNAIDPNILPLDRKRLALTFGSFWSGIKLLTLDAATGKPLPGPQPIALAQRPSPDALEAPFLICHGRWYYLFVSFDFCCRGLESSYNVRVGRSEKLEGPYLDRAGKAMLQGGGTQITFPEGTRIGPGHCAVLHDDREGAHMGGARDYLITHYYDGARNGFPTLQVLPMSWDKDGWPTTDRK